MKPTPLLDFWQKPAGAGEPLAVVATTFALQPDFFEQDCLARFLEVTSVNEDTGSIDDIVASVELHDLLKRVVVTVLADRSAPVERTSLLWDLLSCRVDGGLLHAKIAVLIWENATRIILGSANLTAAGYRRQIELGHAVDLGPGCLFPAGVLMGIAAELQSYFSLVPGYGPGEAVFTRAARTLDLFRERVAEQRAHHSAVRVAFAPTNAAAEPLDKFGAAWNGRKPLRATHLSPFWDSKDPTALDAVRKLLTGHPAEDRYQQVVVVLGPQGQTSYSQTLAEVVDSVRELKPLDQELRVLHAKCLLIESNQWVAALIGSSNHTRAGLGLATRRHREMNVWLGAPRSSKEGKALLDLIQLGRRVTPDAEEVEPSDEDEAVLPGLPACFGLCRVARANDDAPWELRLGIADDHMPQNWSVGFSGDQPILTRQGWEAQGGPATTTIPIDQSTLPTYVLVRWDGNKAPWAVLAEDRIALPPGPALASLRARQFLDMLARGCTLGDVLREELERAGAMAEVRAGINVDPLKRLEVERSLLRRGRVLAASLSGMQRRLERQVVTLETLRCRLAGPLGPDFVAKKMVEGCNAGEVPRAEAIFTIAEIALSVGRVNWSYVLEHVDALQGRALVGETLGRLDVLRSCIGDEPANLVAYSCRAITEARRCLAS